MSERRKLDEVVIIGAYVRHTSGEVFRVYGVLSSNAPVLENYAGVRFPPGISAPDYTYDEDAESEFLELREEVP